METTSTATTVYKGSVYIEPLFGSEQDTYLRLVYGSADNVSHGITPGLFWDLRSLPLPYRPLTTTPLKVILDTTGPGVFFRVQITRERPSLVPTTDVFDFVAESTEHVIQVYLGQGLNVLDVYVQDTTGQLKRCFSTSFTATNFATVLHSHALMITNYLWNPYAELNNALTAPGATGLVSPLIDFDAELPDSHNLFRAARQRVISAMVNQPNSTHSVSVFGGSVFQQTPVVQPPVMEVQLNINVSDWLRPLPSASQTHNSIEMHLWQHDPELARWATYARYLQSQGKLLDHSLSVTESTDANNTAEWLATTKQYNAKQPEQMVSWIDGAISYTAIPPNGQLDFHSAENSMYIPVILSGVM